MFVWGHIMIQAVPDYAGKISTNTGYHVVSYYCIVIIFLSKIIAQVAAKLVLVSFLVICLNPTSPDAICTQLLIRMKRKLLYGTVDTMTGNFLFL